jgi:hypothetical protein
MGQPAAPGRPDSPSGLESGQGVEPLWRHVDVEPNWETVREFMEEDEDIDVISAINKVIRYVEIWHMKETDPHRCMELERWINDLYNLKWEIQGVRMKPCPASR